jgi:drug/metabolite transporter (DMT)-like permease
MHGNIPRGIALKLAQTLFFSLMYAAIKLAPDAPVGEVVFFRCFFALIPLVLFTHYTVGFRAAIRTEKPLYHFLRSGLGSISMFFNFVAVQLLPLATVTAFGFLQPVFVTMLAMPLLGEKAGPWRWGAVLIGFFGVLLMLEPHGGLQAIAGLRLSKGVAFALTFAFLSALVIILIRQMSKTERGEAIVFYFMSWGAIIGAAVMAFEHPTFDFHTVFWLTVCGLLGGLGQIALTYCYRYAEPSLLASFDYISMIWAVLLGYFVLGEMPETAVMLGAAVVIFAGLIIVWRERVHRLAHPPAELV